jgi:hypothetical protein
MHTTDFWAQKYHVVLFNTANFERATAFAALFGAELGDCNLGPTRNHDLSVDPTFQLDHWTLSTNYIGYTFTKSQF